MPLNLVIQKRPQAEIDASAFNFQNITQMISCVQLPRVQIQFGHNGNLASRGFILESIAELVNTAHQLSDVMFILSHIQNQIIDPKLLDDGGEISKLQGRGGRFDSWL